MDKSSLSSFIVVAFYTKNTPYEREVRKLKKSCDKFKIPYHITGIKPLSSWEENCAQKPAIIIKAMEENLGKNIVYLDADARIIRYPKLFDDLDADFAAYYLGGAELLSGTLFFRNCFKTYQLVSIWNEVLKEANVAVWDQVVLQDCVRSSGARLELNVKTLPATYTLIFDTMADAGPPVIKHMQASRRYKQSMSV